MADAKQQSTVQTPSPAQYDVVGDMEDGAVNHHKLLMELPWKWIVLWGFVALCTFAVATVILTDNTAEWPSVRSVADPMVISHIFAILPLMLAIDRNLPLVATVICASTVASFFYHMFGETSSNSMVVHLDVVMACILCIIMLALMATTLTLTHSPQMFAVTVLLGALALVCYVFAGHNLLSDPGTEFEARRERLHPLWHCLAFVALATAIFNFHRNELTLYSRNRFVYAMQTFSF